MYESYERSSTNWLSERAGHDLFNREPVILWTRDKLMLSELVLSTTYKKCP